MFSWLSLYLKTRAYTDSRVHVRNFGIVEDQRIFRGAWPDARGIKDMYHSLGIKTILNLAPTGNDRRLFDERLMANAYHITLRVANFSDTETPDTARVEECVRLIADPANAPCFVHCQGARHRTGMVIAAYRISRCGWSNADAFAEAVSYGYYDALNHKPIGDWIKAYKPTR